MQLLNTTSKVIGCSWPFIPGSETKRTDKCTKMSIFVPHEIGTSHL